MVPPPPPAKQNGTEATVQLILQLLEGGELSPDQAAMLLRQLLPAGVELGRQVCAGGGAAGRPWRGGCPRPLLTAWRARCERCLVL